MTVCMYRDIHTLQPYIIGGSVIHHFIKAGTNPLGNTAARHVA